MHCDNCSSDMCYHWNVAGRRLLYQEGKKKRNRTKKWKLIFVYPHVIFVELNVNVKLWCCIPLTIKKLITINIIDGIICASGLKLNTCNGCHPQFLCYTKQSVVQLCMIDSLVCLVICYMTLLWFIKTKFNKVLW